jgi:hypothetical protein
MRCRNGSSIPFNVPNVGDKGTTPLVTSALKNFCCCGGCEPCHVFCSFDFSHLDQHHDEYILLSVLLPRISAERQGGIFTSCGLVYYSHHT